jgi:hypothetical protein
MPQPCPTAMPRSPRAKARGWNCHKPRLGSLRSPNGASPARGVRVRSAPQRIVISKERRTAPPATSRSGVRLRNLPSACSWAAGARQCRGYSPRRGRAGGLCAFPAANYAHCESEPVISGSGRAGCTGCRKCLAAESAQADFAVSQRRIHSLQRADGTLPDQILNRHHSLQRADGALPNRIHNGHHSLSRAGGVQACLASPIRLCPAMS